MVKDKWTSICNYVFMSMQREGPERFIHSLLKKFLLNPYNIADICQVQHGPQAQRAHIPVWKRQKPNKQI